MYVADVLQALLVPVVLRVALPANITHVHIAKTSIGVQLNKHALRMAQFSITHRPRMITQAWLQMGVKVAIAIKWDFGDLIHQIRPPGFQLVPEGPHRDDDRVSDQTLKRNVICT